MAREVPPEVRISTQPVLALEIRSERLGDPGIGIFRIYSPSIVISERLVGQTINCLPILPRFENVPAGILHHPRHIPVLVECARWGERTSNGCPDSAGQP